MKTTPIDGNKNDIRVLFTGPNDSPDAGLVNGAPIDPPDEYPGWTLVEMWVEHDTEQTKSKDGVVVTRKVNPGFYQLWVRPKSPPKKAKKTRAKPMAPVEVKADGEAKPAEPKKKRGRGKKTPAAASPPNGESGDAPETTIES